MVNTRKFTENLSKFKGIQYMRVRDKKKMKKTLTGVAFANKDN